MPRKVTVVTERGRLIVLEGIDGSGKSTQAAFLTEALSSRGVPVHYTREPTDGPIGSLIRQSFNGRVDLDDRVIAALFVADRIDHLTNRFDGILSLMASGVTVVSDRYYFSSHAYHSSDVDHKWIDSANSISTNLVRPDLTIFIDVDPVEAVKRLESGRTVRDRFEGEVRLRDARKNYLRAIREFGQGDNVWIVSGDQPAGLVAEAILRRVIEVMGIGSSSS